jgi:hypothetical protein
MLAPSTRSTLRLACDDVGVTFVEGFSDAERALLEPFVTDLDAPVFALVNLPETIKGALFARYSRYPGTLRRLMLDEFADDLLVLSQSAPPGRAGREPALRQHTEVDVVERRHNEVGPCGRKRLGIVAPRHRERRHAAETCPVRRSIEAGMVFDEHLPHERRAA